VLSRRRFAIIRSGLMLPGLLAGLVALPGCGGCMPIEVTVRDAPTPAAGQPLVLVAEARDNDGRPVVGLGVTFDRQLRDRGRVRVADAVTDADGVARLVLNGGLGAVQPMPGDQVVGYTAYFDQGNPGQKRTGSICSDRSDLGRIGDS
jgi:hypothetical protein